jgi:hypothetical protein
MSAPRCELCGHKPGTAVDEVSRALFVLAPAMLSVVRWALWLFSCGRLVETTQDVKRLRAAMEDVVAIIEERGKS